MLSQLIAENNIYQIQYYIYSHVHRHGLLLKKIITMYVYSPPHSDVQCHRDICTLLHVNTITKKGILDSS